MAALLVAAPASAGATAADLRPDGQLLAGWTPTPSTTARWDVVNDPVVALGTPPATISDYLSSTQSSMSLVEFTLTSATIPAGESVQGVTAWAYLQTGSARTIIIWPNIGGTAVGDATIAAGSPAGWYPVPITGVTTQSQLDALELGFTHSGGSGTANFIYAAYVAVDFTEPAPPPPPPPVDPPADDPPADDPPADDPPADDPPADDPPADDPPADDPPADDPPADDPPADDPPADDPPVDDPPVVEPPVLDPPVLDPPVLDPPVLDPPVLDPPVLDPPVVDEPKVDPPVETDDPVDPIEDIVEPAVAIATGSPTATKSGDVPVTLGCPDTSVGGCTGVLWLEEPLAAGGKSKGKGSKGKSDRLTAARRSPKRFSKPKKYKLKQGQRRKIPVRLDRRSFRKFKKKRSFKVTVVAQQKDASGQVVTMRRTVRVFNTKKRKR